MPNNKLTDTEIIKTLECCTKGNTSDVCSDCPLLHTDICTEEENGVMKLALDLINRLKGENEKLVNIPPKDPMDFCGVVCNYAEELIEKAKSEAVKEFAERLKGMPIKCDIPLLGLTTEEEITEHCNNILSQVTNAIDNLLKEMG